MKDGFIPLPVTGGRHGRLSSQELCPTPNMGNRGDHKGGARSPGYMVRNKVVRVLLSSFSCLFSKQLELLSGSPVIWSVCLWFISLRPFFLNVKSYKGWSVTSEHRFSSYIGHYRILSRFLKCYTVGSC